MGGTNVDRGDRGYSDDSCFQILEVTEINLGKKKCLPQLLLSLPNNMDPYKYFSGYILKNARRKQKFVYAKNVQF